MAQKAWESGIVALYGIAIGDALNAAASNEATTEDLIELRDQVSALIAAQGDLPAALKALEDEIARRGASQAITPTQERFVVQFDSVALPATMKAAIERSLIDAAMAQIAQIDTGGDKIATPLSRLRGLLSWHSPVVFGGIIFKQ
jgi:hypothetical protein